MSHAPFIWASYSITVVVLLWCALAPLAKRRSLTGGIRRMIQLKDGSLDSDT
jgi:heme exporter protein CcmD